MAKCFYHPKTESVTQCVACKMPVCPNCRDGGAKGLCNQCHSKRAAISVAPANAPKTVAEKVAAARATAAATASKAGQPTGPVYCFRHEEIQAETACITCKRPYCPACLNAAGICGVCARNNKEAQAKLFGVNEKGAAILAEQAEKEAAKRLGVKEYAFILAMVVGVGVSYKAMNKPPEKVDHVTETLEKSKKGLSANEAALLASIKNEKRVKLQDPPKPVRVAAVSGEQPAAGRVAAGEGRGSTLGGGTAPAAAAPAEPLAIHGTYPDDGAIIGGTAVIRAVIGGSPSRVVCEVDGVTIGSSRGNAPAFNWNTRNSGNGAHQITVTAYSGGASISTTFTLNVNNH